jgi:hypothetical protein
MSADCLGLGFSTGILLAGPLLGVFGRELPVFTLGVLLDLGIGICDPAAFAVAIALEGVALDLGVAVDGVFGVVAP